MLSLATSGALESCRSKRRASDVGKSELWPLDFELGLSVSLRSKAVGTHGG